MLNKVVAIHQPNFFPWLGFFNKLYKSDIFVFLDHVQNNPRSAIYTKRVKILANRQEFWLTCNLKSSPDVVFMPIQEMRIDNPIRTKDKHLKTIEINYRKAPFFYEIFPIIEFFYNHTSEFISSRNIETISLVCNKLNLTAERILSSSLNCQTSSNELLIDIVKHVGGNCYMPGGGASEYQLDSLFEMNNIEIRPQNFEHPVYKHFNNDTPIKGLSIIDALMNLGFSETEKLVKNA